MNHLLRVRSGFRPIFVAPLGVVVEKSVTAASVVFNGLFLTVELPLSETPPGGVGGSWADGCAWVDLGVEGNSNVDGSDCVGARVIVEVVRVVGATA